MNEGGRSAPSAAVARALGSDRDWPGLSPEVPAPGAAGPGGRCAAREVCGRRSGPPPPRPARDLGGIREQELGPAVLDTLAEHLPASRDRERKGALLKRGGAKAAPGSETAGGGEICSPGARQHPLSFQALIDLLLSSLATQKDT